MIHFNYLTLSFYCNYCLQIHLAAMNISSVSSGLANDLRFTTIIRVDLSPFIHSTNIYWCSFSWVFSSGEWVCGDSNDHDRKTEPWVVGRYEFGFDHGEFY